ncbi:hypothetical protein EWM64_g7683 [Hericium alpestre]|uniref:N-acetyltransferase domain-containing protein n=1 Tax=Hericium alpestre TaxID=135208 RepID=A0A4Y9ZQ05_9AGAM|nr:hypothetical protein EWM64_g7683 [Hericium alpestre]
MRKFARRIVAESEAQGDDGKDIISVLLRANASENPKSKLSDSEVNDQISTLLLAGHETSSGAIGWLFYELAQDPIWQAKIRDEIAVARERLASRGETDFSVADLEGMTAMQAAIKESLRLHPIVWQFMRVAAQDDVLPLALAITTNSGKTISDIPIPKGQNIIISVCSYNRLPEIWGEDADRWNPERFMHLDKKKQIPLGVYSNLMNFSGGVRACIGWRFTIIEAQVVTAALLEHFEFSLLKDQARIFRKPTGLMTAMSDDHKTVKYVIAVFAGRPLSSSYPESPEDQRALIDKVASMFNRARLESVKLDQATVVPIDVANMNIMRTTRSLRFTSLGPGLSGRPLTLVSVHGQTIDREKIRPKHAFYYEMDGVSHGLIHFSTAVFDRCEQIKDDVVNSGSRVWGKEINEWRQLAYIEEVVVNKDYRRQGIGSWALRAVLEQKELAHCPWIFAWPSVLNDNLSGPPDTAEVWNANKAGVVSLYRKLGFRRVGDTFIFGYARDETHASRHLLEEEDGEEKPRSGTSSEQVFDEQAQQEFNQQALDDQIFDVQAQQAFDQQAFDEQFDGL